MIPSSIARLACTFPPQRTQKVRRVDAAHEAAADPVAGRGQIEGHADGGGCRNQAVGAALPEVLEDDAAAQAEAHGADGPPGMSASQVLRDEGQVAGIAGVVEAPGPVRLSPAAAEVQAHPPHAEVEQPAQHAPRIGTADVAPPSPCSTSTMGAPRPGSGVKSQIQEVAVGGGPAGAAPEGTSPAGAGRSPPRVWACGFLSHHGGQNARGRKAETGPGAGAPPEPRSACPRIIGTPRAGRDSGYGFQERRFSSGDGERVDDQPPVPGSSHRLDTRQHVLVVEPRRPVAGCVPHLHARRAPVP